MRQTTIGSAPTLCATNFPGDQVQRLAFQGVNSGFAWPLAALDPEMPADWSAFEYLVVELKVATPQRFFVRLHTANGLRQVRIQPVGQGVWFRAAIPLRFLRGQDQEGHDLASTINRPRNSFWMSVEGPFGSLTEIEALEIAMEYPANNPTMDIRLIGLAAQDPGAEILEQLPVVDEFGQWRPADWPGKATSLGQLQAEWDQEDRRLGGSLLEYSRYGGYRDHRVEGTGFFRVQEINGRWWFVDPDGYLFLSTGVNGMAAYNYTRVAGRESYYAALPPLDSERGASFYTWNLQRRYGEDWFTLWAKAIVRRMDAWGLNTMYVWDPKLLETHPCKPYVLGMRGWLDGGNYLGLPDVYSDEFARRADEVAARACAPYKDDPYLLGYFVGNEPPWPDRESELVDMILAGPPTAIQGKARDFLARGDTPLRRREFVLSAFERYLDLINAAVRSHDPNHLNLGIRFGLEPPEDIIRMGSRFDVYSLNTYSIDPTPKVEHAGRVTGRPTLLGEFHFGAPGRGLGAGLVQARAQRERGMAYRYYVENALANPSLIGVHWFQWLDQPVTGRMDGENYNIGFIDGLDRPHWEFIEGVKEAHRRLYAIHAGQESPTTRKAERQ